MRGWFDAFRTEGGPTLYAYSNRTPVTGDLPTIAIYVIFFTIYIAFLIIFPGIRKQRFTTFSVVTASVFVGIVICVTLKSSCWHVSESIIKTDYRSFSTQKLEGRIGIYIGLAHLNVTLESGPTLDFQTRFSNETNPSNNFVVDYNERFHWEEPTQISHELRDALYKGLPYPILTVLEYFSLDDEGFSWGRMYRLAGYYSSLLLWFSVGLWFLTNLLLVVVPRYGAYFMVITGTVLLTTNLVYYMLLPEHALHIRFEDKELVFHFGWSYWLLMIAGGLCTFVGSIISIVDLMYPHTFSTILEVDYDTPYDRHIIIEESVKGKGRRSLEDPDSNMGFGRKILRTLSKRNEKGLVNGGFEMDQPKSPWLTRHHLGMDQQKHLAENGLVNAMSKNPALARLAAPNHIIIGHNNVKIPKSVSFRRQSRLESFNDVKQRPDSDDDNSSNCSHNSETCDNNLHHFKGSKVDVNDLNGLAELPKPRPMIPRASYDSNHSNPNSRRGSDESNHSTQSTRSRTSDNHSLSEFSSNSFDAGSRRLAPEGRGSQEFITSRNNITNNKPIAIDKTDEW